MAGRPRSRDIDTALQETALALFVEGGLPALTFEQVATRAGVSRAALYRRWSSRDDLLRAALETWRATLDPGADSWAGLSLPVLLDRLAEGVGAAFADPTVRALLVRLVTLGPEGRAILQDYVETAIAPRRAAFAEVIRQAQAADVVDAGLDPLLVQDALAGALTYALLSGAADQAQFDAQRYVRSLFRLTRLQP